MVSDREMPDSSDQSTSGTAAQPDGGVDTASASTSTGTGTGTNSGSTPPAPDAPEPSAPIDDEEMPLGDHIEEMVRRLGVVLVLMALVSAVVFPFGDRIINFLWYATLPQTTASAPRLYEPLALILARLKVATLAGFVVALPMFVYQSYRFMRPGLYPRERKYYLAAVPTSLVLATIGVLFAFFLILPAIFTYFLSYTEPVAGIAFSLTDTFGLIVLLMGAFALIFQIPLFVMLAIMMGLTTRVWLTDRRLYFWGGFAGLAFLFSPDPTGMAPILVAVTMIGLFESTLFLLKWTGN
jgi:sec-independent protein translocase protein TatC